MTKLAVRPREAAAMLDVSLDYFTEHVRPYLKIVREGRAILVPVSELQTWLEARGLAMADLC